MSIMRTFFLAILFLITLLPGHAAWASRDGSGPYFGLGLFRSMSKFKAAPADSNFNGWGGVAVLGIDIGGESGGVFFEGEAGHADLMNTLQSSTYMEKATNTFFAGKAGFRYGVLGLGGGAQQNNLAIENVASVGSSGKNSYAGLSYMGFARLTFEGRQSFQTILELKYGFGQFSGLDLTETQIGLRFVFSPF